MLKCKPISQMPTVTLRLCLSTVIAHAARD